MKEINMKYDQEWAANKIAIPKEEPTLEELMRQMSKINIKFQEWADEKNKEETDVVARREKTDQMIGEIADYVQEMKSPHDPDITLDPGTEAPTSAIDTLEKKWGISTVFKANPNDLHEVELAEPKIATPLTAIIQPLLMEEKSLINHEGLKVLTCEDQLVHHINTEDENVLEFLGDFNFSNPIKCTNDEIYEFLECTNSCDASLDREVVDVAILAKSTEQDCSLADGSDIVLEVIQEEEEQMLPIFQVDTASGEENDIILPSLKLQRLQPPLFKVKPISLISSSTLATPSIIVGTFESTLYQPPPPSNLHFIPSPTPTRSSTCLLYTSPSPRD